MALFSTVSAKPTVSPATKPTAKPAPAKPAAPKPQGDTYTPATQQVPQPQRRRKLGMGDHAFWADPNTYRQMARHDFWADPNTYR
jgi:hypothetical protein